MNKEPYYPLPREVQSELDHAELAETLEAWQLSELYCSQEPPLDEFRQMGAGMWPVIAEATRPRLTRVFIWQRVPRMTAAVALAACIAVVLAVGITLTQQPVSLTAPLGDQISHELPDGSSIVLNSGTHIQYKRDFGKTSRNLIILEGDIDLNVVPNSTPFVVESFDAHTEVLGTSFSVRSWPDEINAATHVFVSSGRVKVTPITASELAVTLAAGQSARVRHDGQAPLVMESKQGPMQRAWVDGGFKFSEEPLGNVVKEIERRYDVEITIASPALETVSIGVLKESPEGPEEIIRDICALKDTGCDYRAVPGGFVLDRP
ncbi:MAG: FecR domain-containing protein [Bacteroidota bacterium]|nr:FecR domain-containing protein [Bacteroidota bacterium]